MALSPASHHKVHIDIASFPDRTQFSQVPPTTIRNIKHLLDMQGVKVRFNLISKKTEYSIPGVVFSRENADNASLTHIESMVAEVGMSTARVGQLVHAIADEHHFNPAADWIMSREWDGTDRLPSLYSTLTAREDFPEPLKETVMYRWFLSAAAAALSNEEFKTRGVLTLQGKQSIGKSSWIRSLVNDPSLSKTLIRGEYLLDTRDKDSVLTAISYWIGELGEVESTFKKDLGKLKAFITNSSDQVRRPYAKADSYYPRRTVFAASVNMDQFLIDPTGNTRWMTIPVVAVSADHGIDMQQVFAQLAVDFYRNEQWWLSAAEEQWLESFNKQHMVTSAVTEKLMNIIDTDRMPTLQDRYRGTVELLGMAGIAHPKQAEMKEAAQMLRDLYGDPKKQSSGMKWRVPLRNPPSTDERKPHDVEF